jgi:hypothetical protein|tara:strand:- start:29858 stop:31357 length:1500 start_codon:yes stop_codon:yes gene_type:complete
MVTVTNVDFNSYLNPTSTYTGELQTGSSSKDSKAVNFFELLYSYPSKFKIKWNALDELKEDLFLPSNYDVLEHSFPFIDYIDDWLFSSSGEEAQSNDGYNFKDLREGFLDKRYSSNFYQKQTTNIQKTLASVPVYVILNGLDEIVLTKPRNLEGSQSFNNSVKQVIYDYCGAFDSSLERRQQVGFFFTNRLDAENYLQEIARADVNGTETVGLSIHCVGLDSAYNITREHHPGIDFRIIPDLQEVKELLTKNISKSSIIVEDEQQQLRFRRRSVNVISPLGELGRLLSPSSSFLQRDEYFKGVPIYIVQTTNTPPNIAVNQYFNLVGLIDVAYGRFIQTCDSLLGCGHNWIMQGSLKEIGSSDQVTNYVFFSEKSAEQFVKQNGNSIIRYPGSRTSNAESLVRKPKIYLYNLEDFVELWEEKILADKNLVENNLSETIFNAKQTLFIPPEFSYREAQNFFESSDSNAVTRTTKQVLQTISVKSKVLTSFVGILFSVGYN